VGWRYGCCSPLRGNRVQAGQKGARSCARRPFADIVFPMAVRNRLIAEGRAEPHHILSNSGWITFQFRSQEDVGRAVELFRLSYEHAHK